MRWRHSASYGDLETISVRTTSAPKILAPPKCQHNLPYLYLIAVFEQLIAPDTLTVHIDTVRAVLVMQHIAALLVTVVRSLRSS